MSVHKSHTRNMKHKTREATNRIADRAREFGDDVREAARDRIDDLQSTAADYLKMGRDQAAQWEQSLEDRVSDRPIMALLAASACGFLCGLILARR
jgi:ElaB/YqjD/DUF883 family membrane-anchored ribosome-binding protein